MSETLVVFGNCQAEAIAASISNTAALAHTTLVYVPSFNITEEQIADRLTEEVRDSCTWLLEQVTPHLNLSTRYKFPQARRVTFGSLDFNPLWPLRSEEKRIRPELPLYPWGRYTYGDRVINEILDLALTGDEAWAFYQTRAAELLPNIARLVEIEARRWRAAERDLDVQMADLIFPKISDERLFWTYNHPSRDTLCRFGGRILKAAGFVEDDEEGFNTMLGVLTWEFGSNYHQPVHPKVAEALDLKWWSPDMRYRRFDDEMTYEEFIRGQIAWE